METVQGKSTNKKIVIAQEIAFAKVLAGNNKTLRDRAVKKLKKWLTIRGNGKWTFTEDEFIRIWTGLFYCMWMSDKFLIQEELAESISKLIHCFKKNSDTALLFVKCFHKRILMDWEGLDQYRIDKFNMLVRRFLRQTFVYCKEKDWEESLLRKLMNIFYSVVLHRDNSLGFVLHFISIYAEELAKVSKGKIGTEKVLQLIEPFVKLIAKSKDARIQKEAVDFFYYLMKQTDTGIEFEEKFNAWKEQGFPGEGPHCLKVVQNGQVVENGNDSMTEEEDEDEDEDDTNNEILDPRAGSVHVFLPQIPLDVVKVILLFQKYQNPKRSNVKGRRILRDLTRKYEALKRGRFPFNVKKDPIITERPKKKQTLKNATKLLEFTDSLDDGPVKTKEFQQMSRELEDVESDDEENQDFGVDEIENEAAYDELLEGSSVDEIETEAAYDELLGLKPKPAKNEEDDIETEAVYDELLGLKPKPAKNEDDDIETEVALDELLGLKPKPAKNEDDDIETEAALDELLGLNPKPAKNEDDDIETEAALDELLGLNPKPAKNEDDDIETEAALDELLGLNPKPAKNEDDDIETEVALDELLGIKPKPAENKNDDIETEVALDELLGIKPKPAKNKNGITSKKASKLKKKRVNKNEVEKVVIKEKVPNGVIENKKKVKQNGNEEVVPKDKKKKGKNRKKKAKKTKQIIAEEEIVVKPKRKQKITESPSESQENKNSQKVTPLIKTGTKRKILSTWQVQELDSSSPEYYKIETPKIIRIERKIGKNCSCEENENERQEEALVENEWRNEEATPKEIFPVFWEKAKAKVIKKNGSKSKLFVNPLASLGGDSRISGRRISFALDKNMAQENEQYLEEVKNSPRVPFDGSKKPVQSALKSGLAPSPVNPFYRFKKIKF